MHIEETVVASGQAHVDQSPVAFIEPESESKNQRRTWHSPLRLGIGWSLMYQVHAIAMCFASLERLEQPDPKS